MTIRRHLRHTVDVVHITRTHNSREETVDEDVKAFISYKNVVVRGTSGDTIVAKTFIILHPDATVSEEDEIIANGSQRVISSLAVIRHPRTNQISHYEIVLE